MCIYLERPGGFQVRINSYIAHASAGRHPNSNVCSHVLNKPLSFISYCVHETWNRVPQILEDIFS